MKCPFCGYQHELDDRYGCPNCNGEGLGEPLRCSYTVGSVRCCEPEGHDGPHLFKCAGEFCPGLTWVASNVPHPTSCTIDFQPRKRP